MALAKHSCLAFGARLKRSRWGLGAVLLLAFALNVPSLSFGWFGDDFAHRRFILDHLSGAPSRVAFWNMFDWRDLGDRDAVDPGSLFGRLPWWAAPDFSFALLRPLSTLSQFLDYLLWPARPYLMHVHNAVLYCVVVAIAGLVYRRLFGPTYAALAASLLFAIDDAHIVSTAWIASRNTLLTAGFVLAVLWLHQRSASRPVGHKRWLAALLLAFAHASSEGAIVVWAYLGSDALFLDRRPYAARLRGLMPLFAVSLVWTALSAGFGYGVRGSAVYVDPRYAPALFASAVMQRLPSLLQAQLAIGAELSALWPAPWSELLHALGLAFEALLGGLFLVYARSSALVRFFGAALIGALVPQCAAGNFARLLMLSGFAAHGLIVALGQCLWQASRRQVPARPAWLAYGAATLALHGGIALSNPPHSLAFARAVHNFVSRAAASAPSGDALRQSELVVLNFPDYLQSVFVDLYRRELFGPGPRSMDTLGIAAGRVHVTRASPDALIMEPADAGFLLEPSTLLVRRSSDRFRVGDRFPVGRLSVEVLRITLDGRPAALSVSGLQRATQSIWLRWTAREGRFAQVVLPDVGGSLWLDEPDYAVAPGLRDRAEHDSIATPRPSAVERAIPQ